MHVAFIIQDLFRLGAQYVTSTLAGGLVRKGHVVDVLVSSVHTRIGRERPDLRPFPIPGAGSLVTLPSERASRNVLALRRHLHDRRPDFLVVMSSTYVVPSAMALALTDAPTQIVVVEHSGGIGVANSFVHFRHGGVNFGSSWVRRAGEGLAEAVFRSRIRHTVAVSTGVRDALVATKGVDASRVSVIPNPVIDQGYHARRICPPGHPWLREKTLPVVVAAGAHVPLKGYDLLIRAIARVVQDRPCRLVLFGEGPKTGELRALAEALDIAGHVDFPGFSSSLPAEMAAADCFVVSSHVESFSVVLVEALAAGTPVVATNCPSGPPEILQGGRFGTLVPVGDVDALAQAILATIGGKIAPAPAESWSRYDADIVAGMYEDLLLRLKTGPARHAP